MPRRMDISTDNVPGSSVWAIGTEWLGRLAAVIAILLFVLVVGAINKGLMVQQSAKDIVENFHVTNDFFADRTDLTAPATARKQLVELQKVLAGLNAATEQDVSALSATLPDVRRLLAAGNGDVQIANNLNEIASVLRASAGSLHRTAASANETVSDVDALLAEAIRLVDELNAQLTTTDRKLAPLPATGDNR